MDQAAAHDFIKGCGFGDFHGIDPSILAKIPFWSKLQHKSLPPHCLPRLKAEIALIDGEPFYVIPGPNHGQKNVVGALHSPIRTLYFGNYGADLSGAVPLGLAPAAYEWREDTSDLFGAMCLNPVVLVMDPTAPVVEVPWT
jgi:hypothetical protein